ncbi:hypothetical protein ElyMa_002041700 [Elysia marginata]|uniref:Uncharacterized protein n=1 Tax=Elysia marginata TaxID=1093978 RepID=A0AAV4F6Y4_9GAST|nr:hypothetical protein ElyMa_002041700 [Elysia marginata]
MLHKSRQTLMSRRSAVREKRHRNNENYRQHQQEEEPLKTRQTVTGPTITAARIGLFSENDFHPLLQPHSCGDFNIVCTFCKAIRWTKINERPSIYNAVNAAKSTFRYHHQVHKILRNTMTFIKVDIVERRPPATKLAASLVGSTFCKEECGRDWRFPSCDVDLGQNH